MSAHQMAIETQQELRRLPGNNRCVDCDAPYPQWATVSYGTFMCLECSGRHRGLGVHISFVRSVTMDSWTDKQILHMQRGGNEAFREAFSAAGVPTTLSIQQKYNTPQAEAYRARLTALVEGRSATPLPRWDTNTMQLAPSASSSFSSGGGDARGVEALKGESEQDYVARQMRLRDEARARMQAKFGSGGLQGIGSGGETRAPANNGGVTDLSSAFGFLTTTVASAASTAVNLVKEQDLGTKVSSSWSYVQSSLGDPALTQNVKSTAASGWSALASGATTVWQKAVTGQPQQTGPTEIPRFNESLAPSGKYSGIGSDNTRDHDNDSWLDAQLKTSPPKANSFSGLSTNSSLSAAHSASFSSFSTSSAAFGQSLSAPSSSSSFNGTSSSSFSTPAPAPALAALLSAPAAPAPAPAPAPASAPASAPAPAPAPAPAKKKDVDFFAEFGF